MKRLLLAPFLFLLVAGCTSENKPPLTDQQVKEADAHRSAAIDNDTKMTPEQKQQIKDQLERAKHFVPSGGPMQGTTGQGGTGK